MGPSAGPRSAQRRGIGRAGRARACSIAASSNTSRPGSPNAATVTMMTGCSHCQKTFQDNCGRPFVFRRE